MNNMETRNITLTLDKAKEFYKSGNEALKEIALQAFTEDELNNTEYKNITNIFKVLKVLGIKETVYTNTLTTLRSQSKASAAAYKVNLIRQALNKGQKLSLTEGAIYYPQFRFTTKGNTLYDDALKEGYIVKIGTIQQSCGDIYDVFGGKALISCAYGLGYFYSNIGAGYSDASIGFLGCATKEIAKHMSKYFAKDIFDAMYSDFVDYKWL